MSADTIVQGEISSKKLNLESHVQWTVQHIFRDTAVDTSYQSPRFSVSGSEWYFQMFPNGETRNNSAGWIGVYVMRASNKMPPITASFELVLEYDDGEVQMVRRSASNEYRKSSIGWGNCKFLKISQVRRRSELPPSAALTVTCTVRVKAARSLLRMESLSDDFKHMFLSAKGADAVLKVQNEEFPVHRSVLASRSPVFESMFEVDMKEKNTGTVDIVDCDPVAFKDYLVYLYSGQIEISSGDASKLYSIAHKYCDDHLKSECVRTILQNLSIHNFIDVALLGAQFDENELKTKSQEFFEKNLGAIVDEDKWKSLLKNNTDFANQFLSNLARNMGQKKRKIDEL